MHVELPRETLKEGRKLSWGYIGTFRVPLNTRERRALVNECFNDTIRCAGNCREAFAERIDCLMVCAVHGARRNIAIHIRMFVHGDKRLHVGFHATPFSAVIP